MLSFSCNLFDTVNSGCRGGCQDPRPRRRGPPNSPVWYPRGISHPLTSSSVAVKQPVAIGCLWGATAFAHSKLGKYKFVSLVDGPIDLSAPIPISAADVKVRVTVIFLIYSNFTRLLSSQQTVTRQSLMMAHQSHDLLLPMMRLYVSIRPVQLIIVNSHMAGIAKFIHGSDAGLEKLVAGNFDVPIAN